MPCGRTVPEANFYDLRAGGQTLTVEVEDGLGQPRRRDGIPIYHVMRDHSHRWSARGAYPTGIVEPPKRATRGVSCRDRNLVDVRGQAQRDVLLIGSREVCGLKGGDVADILGEQP